MKKLLLLWLGLIGIFFTFSYATFAQSTSIPFNDHEGHIFEEAIEYLFENGIINGYPDGTFKPNKTIQRAELLKIIVASNYHESEYQHYGSISCFPDVPGNEWFTQYVCYAKEKGIVEGYADGNFRPGQEVNLIESLKMMYEGMGMVVDNPNAVFKFKYYSPAMKAGYIPEDLVGGFDNVVTRGQVSEIMYRILNDSDKTMKSDVYLGLTVHKQKYKASCGTAALATALSQNLHVTEDEVINKMVDLGLYPNNDLVNEDGVYIWDDPQEVFVGDYNGSVSIYMSKLDGFGFLEDPLERLAKNWAPNSEKFSGRNLSYIVNQLEDNHPVIVFANVGASNGEVILTEAGSYTISWSIRGSGRIYNAPMYKHNLVVEGYEGTSSNPEIFHIADPFYGEKFEMTESQLENVLKGYDYSGVVIKF